MKRIANLFLLIVLLLTSAVTPGYAKQNNSLVTDIVAWQESGEVRLQMRLDKSYDRVEFYIAQAEHSTHTTFEDEEQLSLHITGLSAGQILLKAFDSGELVRTALYRVKGDVESGNQKLTLRKAKWEKRPNKSQKEVEIELEEANEVERQSILDKQAAAFSKKMSKDDGSIKSSTVKALSVTFELEPNDSFAKADWLYTGKAAYGKIMKNGDTDYWKIKANGNGELKVWLGEIPSGQNYDLYIYDAEDRELGKSESNDGMDEVIEGIGTEKNKWYYIAVRGQDNDYDKKRYYQLKAAYVTPETSVKPDQYEPNNQISDSHMMELNGNIKGSIHNLSDIDFYSFNAPLASTIDLSMKGLPEGMDVDLYLLDKDQKQLAKSENIRNKDESISYNGDPGTYYIKVAASNRSVFTDNIYTLTGQVNTIPVILIPGIGGSRLNVRENGQVSEAWLDAGTMLWDLTEATHRRILPLRPKTPGSEKVVQKEQGFEVIPEEADGGFRAIDYLSYDNLIKGKTEQYFSMAQHLQAMGYVKGKTLIAFPFDWRYGSSDNAKSLKKSIDEALTKSGAKQVQLVAHSMGGLLVKETMLANPSYQGKTRKIIYMGTPFLGAPRAYQAIRYGYDFGIFFLKPETGRLVSEYSPAVHELLPSKEYVKKQSFLNLQAGNLSRPFTYEEFIKDNRIRLPYEPLVRLSGKQHSRWDSKSMGVSQYSIVGQGQPTLMGYDFSQNFQRLIPYFDQANGDGTVPFVSANHSLKDMKKKYYVNEEHSRLMRNPFVIQQVAHLLLGIEAVQNGVRSAPKRLNKYNYYVIFNEDGTFPDVSVTHEGRTINLADSQNEELEGLRLDYHGNAVVVHLLEGDISLQSQSKRGLANRTAPKTVVRHFSSSFPRGKREASRSYYLENNKLNLIGG